MCEDKVYIKYSDVSFEMFHHLFNNLMETDIIEDVLRIINGCHYSSFEEFITDFLRLYNHMDYGCMFAKLDEECNIVLY